jgi:hypothetical protein
MDHSPWKGQRNCEPSCCIAADTQCRIAAARISGIALHDQARPIMNAINDLLTIGT